MFSPNLFVVHSSFCWFFLVLVRMCDTSALENKIVDEWWWDRILMDFVDPSPPHSTSDLFYCFNHHLWGLEHTKVSSYREPELLALMSISVAARFSAAEPPKVLPT